MLRGSAREIQELAGHQNLATTERHMQLTPATLRTTVQLLDQPGNVPAVGDGASADDYLTDRTRVKWWRRRESNPSMMFL